MKNRSSRILLAFVSCMFLAAPMASAQATRTWVSGVGNDADPCSRTAPCRTFAGAIIKTAAAGEISVLDPGGFGTITITKSITINGGGVRGGILGSGVNGVVINESGSPAAGTIVVFLKNLDINGAGTGTPPGSGTPGVGDGYGLVGIKFTSGKALVVEDVVVHGFRTGIEVDAANANVTVNRSVIVNNGHFGGVIGFGVIAKRGTLTLANSLLARNNVAVQVSQNAGVFGTVRLSNVDIYNNLTGTSCAAGVPNAQMASAGNNRKAGNTGGAAPVCDPGTAITVF